MDYLGEDGYKWRVKDIEARPEEKIIDDYGGQQRIYRFFNFLKDTTKQWVAKEYYEKHLGFIKETLFNSGLTTDDNEPPVVLENDKAVMVRIVCKPNGRANYIYTGLKHDEGVVQKVKDIPIVAHKTDNMGQFLRENSNGQN